MATGMPSWNETKREMLSVFCFNGTLFLSFPFFFFDVGVPSSWEQTTIGLLRTLLCNVDANTDNDAERRGPGSVNAGAVHCSVEEVSDHSKDDQIQGKRL